MIRRVRAESTVPILVISARSQEADKVRALEIGADDYMTKPFGLAELRARVGGAPAAGRRRRGGPGRDRAGAGRSSSTGRRVITCNGAALELTPREYELLKTMIAHRGRLLTKGRLLRAVWGSAYGTRATTCTCTSAGCAASWTPPTRRAGASGLIVAEPGVGYRIGSGDEAAGPPD